eukprot:EG_transcript_14533
MPSLHGPSSRKDSTGSNQSITRPLTLPALTPKALDGEQVIGRCLQPGVSYYHVLNVPPTATPDEIVRGHRQVVILVHPDKNTSPRAPEAFKKVTRAFQVLRDPDRRALYDRYGEKGLLDAEAKAFNSPEEEGKPRRSVVFPEDFQFPASNSCTRSALSASCGPFARNRRASSICLRSLDEASNLRIPGRDFIRHKEKKDKLSQSYSPPREVVRQFQQQARHDQRVQAEVERALQLKQLVLDSQFKEVRSQLRKVVVSLASPLEPSAA